MVPDFIYHKWFQGTCEYPNSCWNQHGGMTFDSALRVAFNIQLASRGRHPPVQFRSADGGTMRQINRADAERIIMSTMGDFRRREFRKWCFGHTSPNSTDLTSGTALAMLNVSVKAGVKVGTDEYKLADDVDDAAVKAEYGWYSRGQLYLSSTAAAPTTTSSSTDKDTVPKTLPASVYTTLFEDYNKIPIDADRRQFPEKQLVGAEKVLARM
eukprot:s129_g3.t1